MTKYFGLHISLEKPWALTFPPGSPRPELAQGGDERRVWFFCDKGCHSVYSLRFHYVCCVKYRHKVLTPEVTKYLKEINESIAGKFGVQIIEQETDVDHIHIIFASKPAVQLSKFINSLKFASAGLIFRDHPEVKKQLWGGHFWSPSYFLSTVGEVKLEDVKRYVQSQGRA